MKSLLNKIYLFFINLWNSLLVFKAAYPTLFITFSIVLLVTIVLGITVNSTSQKLTQNENNINSNGTVPKVVQRYFEGKVRYIGKIDNMDAYELVDLSGKIIATLKADDDKLQLVEGLYVKIYGNLIKGSDNKNDILIVKEVILQNGTN